MRQIPLNRAGLTLGECDSQIWQLLLAHVKAYERLSFENVLRLGAGGIKLRKGNN